MQFSHSADTTTGGNVVPFPGAGVSRHVAAANAPRLSEQVNAMVASFGQLHAEATRLQEHTAAMGREAANAAAAVRSAVEALRSFDPAALLRSAKLDERLAERARG